MSKTDEIRLLGFRAGQENIRERKERNMKDCTCEPTRDIEEFGHHFTCPQAGSASPEEKASETQTKNQAALIQAATSAYMLLSTDTRYSRAPEVETLRNALQPFLPTQPKPEDS
jgi:hypothetical protein